MYKSRLIALAIILVVLTTITYSALATNLAITGEATIRAVSDIRVTDIDLDKAENDAVEEYAPKYTKNTITNGIKLPSNNSSISYIVEIKNKGDIDEAIYGLNTVSNNSGLHILIDGEEINSVLPMIIPYRTTREITITYTTTTPSNEAINIVNTFDFREVYYITYNTKGGSEIQRQIKYQNVAINLTNETPTKSGYVFVGWTDEQNGETSKYLPNDLYTLNSNKTLYAIYRYGEAKFVNGGLFNRTIKQLANPTMENILDTTLDTNITSIQRYTSVPSAQTLANAVKVSTDDSEIDIYAWFSNGTIYYYTEAFNPYMNNNALDMFRALTNVTSIDISTVNTSRTYTFHAMFMDCSSLLSLNLSTFDTTYLGITDSSSAITHMFRNCSSLTTINLSTFNTSRITSMYYLFGGCTNLQSITFGNNFDTSNVTSMASMFEGCNSLSSLNLSGFNTSNVSYMQKMFYSCKLLTSINLSSFNTIKVENMNRMFTGCNQLESITFGNNFNTSNVVNMGDMFSWCRKLKTLDLSHFNTNKVTIMDFMFEYCDSLTSLNLSSFNTSIVTTMEAMFISCQSLTQLDISNFDMSSLIISSRMFDNMTALTSLKTPSVYPSNLTITLPRTLYDVSGNGYSTLSTGNPTQTWIKLGYTVVFDKNNNDATGTMNNQIIQFDTATQLHTNTYARYGYVFTGWNTQANGSGTAYLNEASVTSLAQANGTITLYAQWREGEATFTYGGTFNYMIKELAGDDTSQLTNRHNYNDKNITSIQRSNTLPNNFVKSSNNTVSTTDSDYDIYVWYENGTIYYYSEAVKLYMYTSAHSMFMALKKLENVQINNVNTSRTKNFSQLFLFSDKIKKLNLSNFDMGIATDTNAMLTSTTSLEQLKTPSSIASGITINLPTTMYDESGNAYTQLDSTTPTGVWLRKAYTLTANANGGSIASTTGWTGTGNTSTKSVIYNQTYGTLPEPTKSGYTFKGWIQELESELPINYAQVEYIESTGTQYIDTGYVPKTTTKLEVDLSFNGTFKPIQTYGGNNAFLGVSDSNTQMFNINFGTSNEPNTITAWVNKNYGYEGQEHEGFSITDNIRTNKNKLIIENGRVTYETVTRTISSKEVNQDNSMYIFGRNNNIDSKYHGPFTVYNMRVYEMKIYENDVLVRHYVPVLNTNTHKLGLYEIVNGEFHGNIGTGEFNAPYTTSSTLVSQDNNHTLYAIWEPNSYDITYNYNGANNYVDIPSTYAISHFNGSDNQIRGYQTISMDGLSVGDTIQFEYDYQGTDLTVDENNNYGIAYQIKGNVNGWSHELRPRVHITDTGTTDLTHLLVWKKKLTQADIDELSYTGMFRVNYYTGGTLTISNLKVTKVNEIVESKYYNSTLGTLPTLTSESGYQFAGWYTQAIGGTQITTSTVVTDDVIYYAHWTPNTYTINYNGNGSTSGLTVSSSHTYGVAQNLTTNGFSRTGYVFMGWNTASDGSGTAYLNDASVKNLISTNNGTVTLYAQWREGEATFISGGTFNKTIKELANPTLENIGATTLDQNITSIQKYISVPSQSIISDARIVSINTSDYDIYAWYSNGTIYYYSEAINLYVNGDTSQMFRSMANVTEIDISTISTSRSTYMNSMFYGDNNLVTLDVSNFDTSNVTSFGAMFTHDNNLLNLNLSSFNTSNVLDFTSMFGYCNSFTTLDLSSFDMSGVTGENNMGVTTMLNHLISLEQLKTPSVYPSNLAIDLPKTMYDEEGNAYSSLDNTSPTEEWLRKAYTVTFDTDGGTIESNRVFNFDGSTSTIDGTVNNATWGTNYLQFNGSTSWVNLGQINYDYMTMKVSFSVDEIPSSTQTIIGNVETGGGYIGIIPSPTTGLYVITGQYYINGTFVRIYSDIVPQVGEKYDVLLSYDGKVEKMYINSTFIGDEKVEGIIKQPDHSTVMALGTNTTGSNAQMNYFKGKIYSASIYNNQTKSVIYNQQYGTMPSNPTREGYSFGGWSYENNLSNSDLWISGAVSIYGTYADNNQRIRLKNSIIVDENTNYKITINDESNLGVRIVDFYDDEKNFIDFREAILGSNNFEFTTPSNAKYIVIALKDKNDIQINPSIVNSANIIITRNNITSTSIVTQDKDHTLTAKWIPNTYSIVFDKNDNDATGSMSNQSMTYGTSSNLTKNTYKKTGYVFMGWNTASDGSGIAYLDEASVNALTPTNNGTVTLYAQWREGEATFVQGYNFNYMIKDLAGDDTSSLQYRNNFHDTNITSIERANTLPNNFVKTGDNTLSTSTSDYDIYAWYGNGTIYYYTDAVNIYMNINAFSMFANLYGLESIDILTVKTNRTNNYNVLFANDDHLINLNLSNFDMSLASNVTDMLYYMPRLEQLKTPRVYPSSLTIDLPKTLYDEEGNTYNQLTSSSPTEEWLRKAYTVTLNNQNATTSGTTSVNAIYNQPLTSITAPTRTGYTFNGYVDDSTAIQMKTSISEIYQNSTMVERRIQLAYSANNWSLTTEGDTGVHINGKIISNKRITRIDFNDLDLSSSMYEITSNNGIYTLNLDFDVTEEMVTTRNGYNYTKLRFLDIVFETSDGTGDINVDYLIKNGIKYYDSSGTGLLDYDLEENTTLYATWTPNTYTISYDGNGSTGGSTASSTHTYDVAQNLTTNGFTRTGYTFTGWNTAADGLGTAYLDEASVTKVTTNSTITLYAQWIKNPTITFDNNYQSNNLVTDIYNLNFRNNYGGSQTKEIVFDSEINDYVIKLTITSLPNNGTSTCIYAVIPMNDSSLVHTWQLFAKSSKSITNSYYLGIEQNGHYGPPGTYLDYSTDWVRLDKTFTPTSGVTNTAFYVIFTSDLQVGDSVYLYGLSLEEGDNSGNQTVLTKNYGSTIGTLPTEPTRDGYVFDGWYTQPVGGTKISTSTIATTDTTYYAHWLSTDPETRIRSLNTLNTSIADDDPDNNLRYIGANPNNYVSFNNQKWRIIGVIDGKLKLVQDSIGNYSFDTSKETVNRGLGVNAWETSDLMKLLNPGYESNTDLKCKTNTSYVSNNGDGYAIVNCGDNSSSAYEDTNPLVNNSLYWNAGSGLCYTYGNYKASSCSFTSSGLTDQTSKNMIDDATWYLGSNSASAFIWAAGQIMTADYVYNFERGNLTGKQCSNAYYCSDTVTRNNPPTWTGKVGLIYPSDYAYATSGSISGTDRATCLGKQIGYVSSSSTPNWSNTYTDCKDNDWLLDKSKWTWSLSPLASSDSARYLFIVETTGYVHAYTALNAGSVRPVVYLKSGVEIVNGNGSYNTPFTLRLDN